jgi:hypothetical protein
MLQAIDTAFVVSVSVSGLTKSLKTWGKSLTSRLYGLQIPLAWITYSVTGRFHNSQDKPVLFALKR